MNNIDKLRQELDEKLDSEYNNYVEILKQESKDEIIKNAYKLTVKEQIKEEIKDRNLDKDEIKALLQENNVLDNCYDRWIDDDSKLQEAFEFIVDDEIEEITEEYKEMKRHKNKESR